jgi:hypothetical protein
MGGDMSKQQRRNKARHHRQHSGAVVLTKKWILVIGIATGIILLGGALLVIRSNSVGNMVAPKVTGAPAIEVEQSYFNLGDIRFNTMARVIYMITNVGDQPLKILERPQVQVLEGC